MANIGLSASSSMITNALVRTDKSIHDSSIRIATGKMTALASDHAVYATVENTLSLDIAALKSGMKSIGILQGFLGTALSNIDALSNMNSRMMDLAIQGANGTNADNEQDLIDAEALALASAMWKMGSNTYKNMEIFEGVSREVSMALAGHGAEYIFSQYPIDITSLFDPSTETIKILPSDGLTDSDIMTSAVEDLQTEINSARVLFSSGYAVLEATLNNLTDLKTQLQLGQDIISNVNVSYEASLLAKQTILKDATLAMMAQSNKSQEGLIRLVE